MTASAWTLPLAAATIGALHTVAPDHWMPFAALARARNWSAARTARMTILCGFGHVTASALLGVLGVVAGLGIVHVVGGTLESFAPWLLMAFGTAYMLWGLRRSFARDPLSVAHAHDHRHTHGHNNHDHGLTEWSLFVLFSADPCVAVMPMIVAAAANGWPAVLTVIAVYELATIATMVVLALTAKAGANAISTPWLDRFGHAMAGAVIVVVGAAVQTLGI